MRFAFEKMNATLSGTETNALFQQIDGWTWSTKINWLPLNHRTAKVPLPKM